MRIAAAELGVDYALSTPSMPAAAAAPAGPAAPDAAPPAGAGAAPRPQLRPEYLAWSGCDWLQGTSLAGGASFNYLPAPDMIGRL